MTIETSIGLGTGQPYPYQRVELVEPDWTRFPGWKDVTAAEWASVQWQRAHCVKNVKQLRELLGDLVDDRFYADLERDQAERATMSSTARRTASPSPLPSTEWVRSSWRKDAASRLRRSTRMRTSSGQSSLRVSSRWAA